MKNPFQSPNMEKNPPESDEREIEQQSTDLFSSLLSPVYWVILNTIVSSLCSFGLFIILLLLLFHYLGLPFTLIDTIDRSWLFDIAMLLSELFYYYYSKYLQWSVI